MPAKKKKFIDKRNAVTYHLVHRSQRDPLQADEDAPKHVLLPSTEEEKTDARKEEQQTYGITYDDDYDYMQHLRDLSELSNVEPVECIRIPAQQKSKKSKEPAFVLPPEVFASEVETEIGLLNQAVEVKGPQPDWDPDIVAALDEDFDHDDPENQLEDDFMVQAMDTDSMLLPEEEAHHMFYAKHRVQFKDDEDNDDEEGEDYASDEAEMSDAEGSYGDGAMFGEEETRSRFTNYSMTSSVIRRNEGLSMLDDRFEKIYEEYDDTEIGALEHEEITGFVDQGSVLLDSVLDDFEKTQEEKETKLEMVTEIAVDDEEDDSDDEELIKMTVEEKPKEQWDCESILSTYSTLYNHPKVISEPKKIKPITLTKRAGIPDDVLPQRGLTRKQMEESLNRVNEIERVPTYRPKDETPEEKKARKQAIKQERKERREEKKANQNAFKDEKKKQEKVMLNVRQAMQGIKIQ